MSIVTAARSSRPVRAALMVAGAVVVGMTLLGVPAGLVWSALAPRPELVLTADGVTYATAKPSAVIAADGWFAVVTGAAGLLCGGAAHLLVGRRHGEVTLLSLTAGGFAGAFVTWYAGRAVDIARFREQVSSQPTGTHLEGFLHVHATGVLMAWPLLAVFTFMMAQIAERIRRGHEKSDNAEDDLDTDLDVRSGVTPGNDAGAYPDPDG